MMNKTKSAKLQVSRFLFLLPVLAVILLSFRKSFSDSSTIQSGSNPPVFTDTIPEVKEPNNKGYLIDIKDNNGECMVVVKDKDKKVVTRMLLTDWNKKADYYENLYGEIPPAPAKPGEPVLPTLEQWIKSANKDVKSVSVINGSATVTLNNGKTENYDITKKEQKEAFEKKYGEMPEPPLPPVPAKAGEQGLPLLSPVKTGPALPQQPQAPAKPVKVRNEAANFDFKDDRVTVTHKDGVKEVYNLKKAGEKEKFISKYGEPVLVADNVTAVNTNIDAKITAVTAPDLKTNIVSNNNTNAVNIANSNLNTTVNTDNAINAKLATSISSPTIANIKSDLAVTTIQDVAVTADVDILITISKNITQDELVRLVREMKEKGYELTITNKTFNDDVLTNISGTIKHKDNTANFSATGFSKLTIATYRKDDKTYFRIDIHEKKTKKDVI